MRKQEYLDFELEIGPGRGRQYPVAVIRSPAGEARETMRFPFGELALQNRLKDLQIALLYSGGKRRQRPLPEEQAVQSFGRALFDALLTGEIRSRYDVSQERAAEQDKGLRLKLRIQPPGLAALPWEFLYDPRQYEYVCLSRNTPVVRYIELPQAIQALTVTPPLRILGMIASPRDPYLEELDTDNEKQRVERAVKDLRVRGLVDLEWLPGQSWRELQRAMRGGPWHIFHFIGHGGFDPITDEGLIVLADDNGLRDALRATELGRLLANHRSLRLALLNSCEGARGSELDIFSSTASILVRRGIPAVLAMQYEITDHAAIEFARAFYEALADGMPVDAAVAEARVAVSLAVTNTVEWGTPVLYMRAPDGRIFSVDALTPEERAAEAARAEAEARAKREEAERRALEQRKAQLATLYEQATTQLAEQDWVGAEELLAQVQEIEPGYRDVTALLDQAQTGQARAEQLAALLAQGAEYLGRGEWSQAAEAYRQVLVLAPDHPEAPARLAEAEQQAQATTLFSAAQDHLKAKRWAEAIAGLQAVLELAPAHAEAVRQLAEAQAQLQRQQAEERKRREEEARQAELARLYAAANEAAQAKNWSKAIESFQAVLKLDASHRDASASLAEAERQEKITTLYASAQGHLKARRWSEAIADFQTVLKLTPAHAEAARQLAEAQAQLERQQAEERKRREEEARQAELARLYALANEAAQAKNWSKAIESFQAVLKLDTSYRDAPARLAEAESQAKITTLYAAAAGHLEAGRWSEAIAGFQSVLKLAPAHTEAARQLSEAQAQLARQQAEERKRREEEAQQAELTRLYAMANEAAQAKNWSKAIESFQAVLKLDTNYRDVPARLAKARETQVAEEAARQQEAQLANLYETARGRVQARDWPEAERLLREIQRMAPIFRDVEALLAQVTSQREREQRLATLYARAEAHYGKGEWAQAVDLYGQVLALESGYRDAKAKLAETQRQRSLTDRYAQALAHLQSQRWQEAIEGFQAVVAIDPHYCDPTYGSAATLLARAQQKKLAELPAARPPRPTKNLLLWIGGGIGVIVVALVSVSVALRVLLGMFAGNVTTPTPPPTVVQPTKTLVPPMPTPTPSLTKTLVPPTATSGRPTTTSVPPTATPIPQTATKVPPTPAPRPTVRDVPLLVGPLSGQMFDETTQAVELSWQAVGTLATDEFYDVYLTWRAGGKRVEKHWYTQETRFFVGREYFGLSDDGRYEWNIVVRRGQSPDAVQLSPISEQRFFLWQSRPVPPPTWTPSP